MTHTKKVHYIVRTEMLRVAKILCGKKCARSEGRIMMNEEDKEEDNRACLLYEIPLVWISVAAVTWFVFDWYLDMNIVWKHIAIISGVGSIAIWLLIFVLIASKGMGSRK